MGMDGVVITTRRGELLQIVTRDRSAFLAALAEATTGQRHDGHA
ncbi:hypothetical protein ACFWOJ_21785 [Streptomyces sp. NPDC058439]